MILTSSLIASISNDSVNFLSRTSRVDERVEQSKRAQFETGRAVCDLWFVNTTRDRYLDHTFGT